MKSLYLVFSILGVSLSVFATEKAIRLNQGWNEQTALKAYHHYEGSQLIPTRWFLNLKSAKSDKLFIDEVSDYGIIPTKYFNKNSNNPLPMGFTDFEDNQTAHLYGEKSWVGVNCAACHSGMIRIKNKLVTIEGGASLFNIQSFENALLSSVQNTLSNSQELKAFANRLDVNDIQKLDTYLKLYVTEFGGWISRNHKFIDSNGRQVPYGPGRVDGIGGATNDLTCKLSERMGNPELTSKFNNPANCQSSHAPTSLPQMWGISDMEFVQWNGAVHSSIGRNYGQATATYGRNWVEKNKKGKPVFKSTANLDGLFDFEKWYDALEAPKWSDLVNHDLVKEIDIEKAELGKKLYFQNCIECHAIQPEFTKKNLFGNSYWVSPVVSLEKVGTDSASILANLNRKGVIPEIIKESYSSSFGKGELSESTSAEKFRAFIIVSMLKASLFEKWKSPLRIIELSNCRSLSRPAPGIGVKARTLDGVIYTAPYLHNGSVPTVYDLLTPAALRPVAFKIGCRDYDMEKMGYSCDRSEDPNVSEFDTRFEGNRNTGHEYGVNLSEDQKWQLIEFMKTIESPKRPPQNAICN